MYQTLDMNLALDVSLGSTQDSPEKDIMPAKNVSATLLTDSGAVRVSRKQLSSLSTPLRTSTYTPVAHSVLIEHVEKRLSFHGLRIIKEEYAVQSAGAKLFGAVTVQQGRGAPTVARRDFAFAIAIRASNDKTFPIEFAAGVRVFVCSNGCFSGEAIILHRKHTARLDIQLEICGGIDRAVAQFAVVENRILMLKGEVISDVEAKATIFDAAHKGVMPWRLASGIYKNYVTPPHVEFEPRTQWSLHNSFTESFKELKPNIALESTLALGKLFDI
jgi:hypothetical protein